MEVRVDVTLPEMEPEACGRPQRRIAGGWDEGHGQKYHPASAVHIGAGIAYPLTWRAGPRSHLERTPRTLSEETPNADTSHE